MHQLQLSLGCCVKWITLICDNMQEEKEVKPPNITMKHREERETQALNNSYYRTRTGRTLRRGSLKYKHYWKVESDWTHLDWHCMSSKPKSEIIRKSHTQRIHNDFNENSNTFIQGMTYGVSLISHYWCGYKEITAVSEEKKKEPPSFSWCTHSLLTDSRHKCEMGLFISDRGFTETWASLCGWKRRGLRGNRVVCIKEDRAGEWEEWRVSGQHFLLEITFICFYSSCFDGNKYLLPGICLLDIFDERSNLFLGNPQIIQR